jgi:hypothetical protein
MFPSDQQGLWPCQRGKELAALSSFGAGIGWESIFCNPVFSAIWDQFFGSRDYQGAVTP